MGIAFEAGTADGGAYPKRLTYVINSEGVIIHAIDTKDPKAQADEILAAL